MTRSEAVAILQECSSKITEGRYKGQRIFDPSEAHKKADNVLCSLLVSLGYADIVELYEEVEKWYA